MLINADVGECGITIDSKVMPHINMASIACGGHIGDKNSIKQTVLLASKNNCLIGAHISYDDKENFGRSTPNINSKELYKQIKYQLKLMQSICLDNQITIDYIKPHGALYHDAIKNFDKFKIILKLANEFCIKKIITQKDAMVDKKKLLKNNTKLLFEVFADRKYINEKLLPRSTKGAVLDNPEDIVIQYNKLKNTNYDTICFHSDNPASILALEML